MNKNIERVVIGAISGAVSAAATYFTTRHILNKRNDQNTSEIHAYYRDIVKECKDCKSRLRAMEKAINEQDKKTCDEIFRRVNEIMAEEEENSEDEEEEDHSLDDQNVNAKSEREMTKELSELAREMSQKHKTPYHTFYNVHSQAVNDEQSKIYESLIRESEVIDMSSKQGNKDWLQEKNGMDEIPEDAVGKTEEEYMNYQWSRMEGAPVRTVGDAMTPYIISQNECGSEWCDIECLIYYDGDGVLANEQDEALSLEDYLGSDELLNHFVDGLLYVRNERLGMDYEIRWDEGSFAENVAGIKFEDAYPKGVKKNAKRKLEDYN